MLTTLFRPRRRLSFYHRAVVPLALRSYFRGKRQVWRSLKTTDPDHARLLTLILRARTQRLFLTLKREGQYMTSVEIDRLIAEWKDAELERLEDARVLHRFDEDQRSHMADLTIEQHEALDDTLEDNRYDRVTKEADELLAAAGVPLLDHNSLHFKRLCRRFLLAKREVLKEDINRWQGNYRPQLAHQSPSIPSTVLVPKSSPLFSEVLEKYLIYKPKAPRVEPQMRRECEHFIASMGGDLPIASIFKQAHCVPYVDSLRKRKLSPGTIEKWINVLSGIFTYAIKQDFIEDGKNPFKGLAPEKATIEKTQVNRRPFTPEELVTIFSAPAFLQQRTKRPERYWIVLLCLFQLCRRDEAAQLALVDIGVSDEIPYMSITNEGPGQALKTKSSKRTIPLHASLIELGFLDYVRTMRTQKQKQLFPALRRLPSGWGSPVGKWFAEHLNRLGLTDKRLVLHSLRHGIHYLHQGECPTDVAQILTGHAPQGVHDGGYGHWPLTKKQRLRDGLEKLQYPEVVAALKKSL